MSCTQIPAVEEATQLSAKIKSTVRDISKINVPGVSQRSDAQLDQMAEVYFRKLSDKKAHTKVAHCDACTACPGPRPAVPFYDALNDRSCASSSRTRPCAGRRTPRRRAPKQRRRRRARL